MSQASSSLSAASVLEAAKVQVRRFGERKTNVVDIARILGVSHATLYRFYPSKSAMMDAIVEQAMRDEEDMAAACLEETGSAEERLFGMLLNLHRRKRERFTGDREIHDLYRRILVERPDMIAAYADRMTALLAKFIAQAVELGEWSVNDTVMAAGVVRDAVTTYIHPAFVAQLIAAEPPAEDMLRATVATLARAFETGVTYG